MRHRLGLATRTQISVYKSPLPSADTAVSLFRAKTVQQRPLLPRNITDRLQRLLNAAARAVSNPGKFYRGLTHLLHSELHWLDVPQRILHQLGVTVHRCLQGKAPQYLVNCCHPISDVASRQRLRSSSRHHLVVPRHRRSTLGRRRSDSLECAA